MGRVSTQRENKEIDAAYQKRIESIPHLKLKDEIKRMIPVRGMSLIDKQLKEFINIDKEKKRVPSAVKRQQALAKLAEEKARKRELRKQFSSQPTKRAQSKTKAAIFKQQSSFRRKHDD